MCWRRGRAEEEYGEEDQSQLGVDAAWESKS